MQRSFYPIMVGVAALVTLSSAALAQQPARLVSDVDRRTGPRSTFQKPIAYDIADHTVLIEGAIFGGTSYLFDALDTAGLLAGAAEEWERFYGGVVDVRLARRTSAAFSYGVDGRLLFSGGTHSDAEGVGRFDVFLQNRYGRISYGNFSDRNEIFISGRTLLAGEASLFYDGFFSPSDERAFRYRGRFSSFLVDAAIDDDGDHYNLGFLYRSPTTTRKDAWSFEFHGGDFDNRYDRHGVSLGYQLTYGSWDFAVTGTYDHFDPYAVFDEFDRVSGSFVVSYKKYAWTWSAGVLLAETNGGDLETAYTVGSRLDLARGLSLNLGYLYLDSDSTGTDGGSVTPGNFSGVRSSISYRF